MDSEDYSHFYHLDQVETVGFASSNIFFLILSFLGLTSNLLVFFFYIRNRQKYTLHANKPESKAAKLNDFNAYNTIFNRRSSIIRLDTKSISYVQV